jgi:hypothetical protein
MALIFAGSAAAFAADTVSYVPPVASNYPVVGGTNVTVENAAKNLTPEQNSALHAVYKSYGTKKGNVELAKVSFALPVGGSVTVPWAKGQLFYNFVTKKFVSYGHKKQVSAASAESPEIDDDIDAEYSAASTGDVDALASGTAAGNYVFTKKSPLSDPSVTDPKKASFLSVKGATQGHRDNRGGCSALTFGAVALFLLPAFALVKRGKK